jgi:AcrR family transcriptional regulator
MTAAKGRQRAPRNSLSRDSILDSAVAVLDERGPGALTMRSLADRLRVGPMALYTYFAGKDELLDAARDHILRALSAGRADSEGTTAGRGDRQGDREHARGDLGEDNRLNDRLEDDRQDDRLDDWEDRLRSVGLGLYRLLVSHPALIHLFATRPLAGHEAADATEAHLRVLRDAGFDRVTAARAHLALLQHALGSATWEVQLNAGRDRASRRRRREALQAMSAQRYPTLVDLAPELVEHTVGEQQFRFGLETILAGLRGTPRGCPVPPAGSPPERVR